jgi:very-short-patch-repair endonuclease
VFKKDLEKDAFLNSIGFTVLKFGNDVVLNNFDKVIKAIENSIYVLTHPQPPRREVRT